jgi:hypothetical protein
MGTVRINQLSTPQQRGFTIVELVVASATSLVILGAALGLLTEQRRWVLSDRTRATANDNLRLATDFMGQDIKQAGERLGGDLEIPGISIIPEGSGTRSRLVLQRQLRTEKLPVCQTIVGGGATNSIDISVATGPVVDNCIYSYTPPPPSSTEASATLTTLLPTENLRAWRRYRCEQDRPSTNMTTDPCARIINTTACQQLASGTDEECSWAYIHDPVNNRGEFFLYSHEDRGTCVVTTFPAPTTRTCLRIRRADGGSWQNTYTYNPTGPAGNQPQLYLLEEREYSLVSDATTGRTDDFILQLRLNRQTPQRIANRISDFRAWAKVPSGFTASPYNAPGTWGCTTGINPGVPAQWYCTSFNPGLFNQPNSEDTAKAYWQNLQGVRVTLTGLNPNEQILKVDANNNFLSLTSEFLPRNVSSR